MVLNRAHNIIRYVFQDPIDSATQSVHKGAVFFAHHGVEVICMRFSKHT